MAITIEDVLALEKLDIRLRTMLPPQYRNSYEDVRPVSMGSAGLKYDRDGNVAWDRIWATFCDLAMAGGPPHRGTLLEPALPEDISARHDQYLRVTSEICRGIRMVAALDTQPSNRSGWVEVQCESVGMAGWLVRAIVMENILAHQSGDVLFLPAGPNFRLEREIKNVITATAKTCHYWMGHIPAEQQQSIEELITGHEAELLESPSFEMTMDADRYRDVLVAISERIGSETQFPCFAHRYFGWIGMECPSVRAAVWLMRAIGSGNLVARREGEMLFLPVNPAADPNGKILVTAFLDAYHLASVRKIA